MTAAAPRLAPVPREQWDESAVAALRHGLGDDVTERFLADAPDARPVPHALSTLLHHSALAGPFLAYNNVLLYAPALDPRMRELMVLRVAFRTQASYEWAQHARLAPRYGVTADEIEAIARHGDAGGWTPLEADLLAATDQLIDRYRVDDDTWARLAAELDKRQLVELVFVVGTYTCLAMAFNSFELELDPDLDATSPLPRLED